MTGSAALPWFVSKCLNAQALQVQTLTEKKPTKHNNLHLWFKYLPGDDLLAGRQLVQAPTTPEASKYALKGQYVVHRPMMAGPGGVNSPQRNPQLWWCVVA